MSDKVLVRKQNETPPPDAYINPENTGQGNTVGMSSGGQGAFLNVDPNRRDLTGKQPNVLENRGYGQPILDANGQIQYDAKGKQILDNDRYVNNPNAGKNKYNNFQRIGGAGIRSLSALGAGIGALSRFSGSEEDAVSASLGAGQDAYTTYGTTAGVERALIPDYDKTGNQSSQRLLEQVGSSQQPKEESLPSAPDVAVLDAQNDTNRKLMAQKPMEKRPVVADSTMRGIDNLLDKPSMEGAVPAEPPNPVKVVDSNQQISSERARFTGEEPTDKQEKYGYGKNDPNVKSAPGF